MHFLAGGNIHLDNLAKILKTLGYELAISSMESFDRSETRKLLFKRIKASHEQIEVFCQECGISYLAFFGSILRKDFATESDIDVLVEFDKPISLFQLVEIEDKLQELLNVDHKVDVVTINSVSPLIKNDIMESCEVIYGEAA